MYYRLEPIHVEGLLNLINNAQFRGAEAEEIIRLKNALSHGYTASEILAELDAPDIVEG